MLCSIAIENYRSLRDLALPLASLNVITGPNGSGKSNLYRALRLLGETAREGIVRSLAREGGLRSVFWAGPESLSRQMRSGEVPIQGTRRKEPVRLHLGFSGSDFGYAIAIGLPIPSASAFHLDPEIKRECIWAGPLYRPAATTLDRKGPVIKVRVGREWNVIAQNASTFESVFDQVADPNAVPEVFQIREFIRGWRFYDHFRTDRDAPARLPQLGTRTPILHHDGRDLAAALQTICEIGDRRALDAAVSDAFPGASLSVSAQEDGRFVLEFAQHGLLRSLTPAELSDGTLRYLLWIAALLTPRSPTLLVMNEPETSLHPDLLPALARLIILASERTQLWVVSHSETLVTALEAHPGARAIRLEKEFGQTEVCGQGLCSRPSWQWPQ